MLAILLALSLPAPAVDALMEVRRNYESLKGFSMDIEHENSSGLFPGAYRQRLMWREGGRFTLTVTRASSVEAKAPDYYCNGKQVLSIWPDGRRSDRELNRDPNVSPGWEVAGGLAVSWLMRTPMADFIWNPPAGPEVKPGDPKATEWRKEKVHEIVVTMKTGGSTQKLSLYVSRDHRWLIGQEWARGNIRGWAHYTNQEARTDLAPTLGDPPQAE